MKSLIATVVNNTSSSDRSAHRIIDLLLVMTTIIAQLLLPLSNCYIIFNILAGWFYNI